MEVIKKALDFLFYASLILVSSFMIWPPALQSIGFSLLLLLSGLKYFNKDWFKKKWYIYLLSISSFLTLILSAIWSESNLNNFNLFGLYFLLIGFLFLYHFCNYEQRIVNYVLLLLIFSGIVYMFLWYEDSLKALNAYYDFHKLENPLLELNFHNKINYIYKEFICKKTLNFALNDGFYYLNEKESLFRHYNYISPFYIFLLILIARFLLQKMKVINKIVLFCTLLIFTTFIYVLGSIINTVLLVLVLFCLFCNYLYLKKHIYLIGFILLIFTTLGLNYKLITNKISNYQLIQKTPTSEINNFIDYTRYELYNSAIKVWGNNKYFGTGINDVDNEVNSLLPKVQIMSRINLGNGVIMNTHSFPLFVLCSSGFLGFLLYAIFWIVLFIDRFIKRDFYGVLIFFVLFSNNLFENWLNRSFGVYIFCVVLFYIQLLNENGSRR